MTDYGYPLRRRIFTDRRRPMPLIRSVLMFIAGCAVAAIWLGVTK